MTRPGAPSVPVAVPLWCRSGVRSGAGSQRGKARHFKETETKGHRIPLPYPTGKGIGTSSPLENPHQQRQPVITKQHPACCRARIKTQRRRELGGLAVMESGSPHQPFPAADLAVHSQMTVAVGVMPTSNTINE